MTDPTFKLLFKKSRRYCVQQLQYLTSSESKAKELFIEAITKYWIKCKKDNAKNIKHPEKYILIIAKHIWYDRNKKKKPEQTSDEAAILKVLLMNGLDFHVPQKCINL